MLFIFFCFIFLDCTFKYLIKINLKNNNIHTFSYAYIGHLNSWILIIFGQSELACVANCSAFFICYKEPTEPKLNCSASREQSPLYVLLRMNLTGFRSILTGIMLYKLLHRRKCNPGADVVSTLVHSGDFVMLNNILLRGDVSNRK